MQPSRPRLARKQWLSCICSTWPTKRSSARSGGCTNTVQKRSKWQPGPIVFIAPAHPHDPRIAGQVALRTDVIAERGRQIGRIDDRHVLAVDQRGTRDVELAGPVAAFTADCVTLEDRRSISVDRACHGLDPVRVAEQAIGLDRPVEVIVEYLKPR